MVKRRHFINAAKDAHYSTEKAEMILNEMLYEVDKVIEKIAAQLPTGFPKQISQSIFDGMRAMKNRLLL
ncbi:MAG: hypothetical protein JO131_09140 [Gammaproteobacteria bacterium]|nr:hypothetical protein [Gammaproteobacteria bacterium]